MKWKPISPVWTSLRKSKSKNWVATSHGPQGVFTWVFKRKKTDKFKSVMRKAMKWSHEVQRSDLEQLAALGDPR